MSRRVWPQVTLTWASWNQIGEWLRLLDALRELPEMRLPVAASIESYTALLGSGQKVSAHSTRSKLLVAAALVFVCPLTCAKCSTHDSFV